MIFLHVGADVLESFVDSIGELQELVFALVDGSSANHVAPVEDFVPVPPAINQDQVM